MIALHIPYKGKNIVFDIPQHWDELSALQLSWISRNRKRWGQLFDQLRELEENPNPNVQELVLNEIRNENIRALTYLSGCMKSLLGFRAKVWATLYPDEINWLLPDIQFIFKKNNRTVAPFEKLRVGFNTWYPAGDSLDNFTALEFHFADICFDKWKKGDSESLEHLCAILYRPKGKGKEFDPNNSAFSGDVREAFNNHSLEIMGKKLRSVSRWKLEAIALWYEGCRNRIVENNPAIFSKSGGGGQAGWLGVFRSLASGFTSIESVGKQSLSLLLYELNELEAERRRQVIQSAKRK